LPAWTHWPSANLFERPLLSVGNFEALHNSAETLKGSIGQLVSVVESAIAENGSAQLNDVTLSEDLKFGTILDGLLKTTIMLSSLTPGDIHPSPELLKETRNYIDNCNNMIIILIDFFRDVITSHGGGAKLDSFSRIVIANNGNMLNFGSQIDSFYPQYDKLIRLIPSVLALSSSTRRRGPAIANIAAAASIAAVAAKTTTVAAESAEKSTNEIFEKSRAAVATLDEVQRIKEKLTAVASEADLARASAEKSRDDADQAKSEVLEIQKIASSEKSEIEFAAGRLNTLYKEISDGQSMVKLLEIEIREHSQKITDLTQRANAMITGATVSGLATSFGNMQNALALEVEGARKSVRTAIWVTIALSSPLWLPTLLSSVSVIWGGVVSFFAGFGHEWAMKARAAFINQTDQPSFPTNGYALTAYLAARSALVVPGIVLLWFAIRRFNALFLLREHYAYKYSMAMSVTGFKLEASDYQQEIAAMTLAEVAFNPGDSLAPPRRRQFGPRRFFSKLAGKIEDAAAEKAKELAKKVTPTDPS
jgi:hypothetical protein